MSGFGLKFEHYTQFIFRKNGRVGYINNFKTARIAKKLPIAIGI